MSDYRFDDNPGFVADYERMPRLFVPGYDAAHMMTAALLQLALPRDAHLLVIGAGGGVELARFAAAEPGWRFTAVDPSAAMLAQAEARLAKTAPASVIAYHQGIALDAPTGPFDAATALLALTFVPDDGQRLAQLQAVQQRLRPGAPFILIDGISEPDTPMFDRDLARYQKHARLGGADDELIAIASGVQRDSVYQLPAARYEALLQEAGFRDVELFYKAFWTEGRLCVA